MYGSAFKPTIYLLLFIIILIFILQSMQHSVPANT